MKRFTDTEKWKDSWFRKLPSEYKNLWQYITDNCDNAGIWKPDFELASFFIGQTIESTTAINLFNENKKRIKVLENSKWYITDFISFQYGELTEKCKPHLQVLSLLKKHNLTKEYAKGILTLQEKDKEQDKDIEKDKDQNKDQNKEKEDQQKKWFKELLAKYPNNIGSEEAERHFLSSVKSKEDYDAISKALANYKVSERVLKGFVLDASKWFKVWHDWIPIQKEVTKKCNKCLAGVIFTSKVVEGKLKETSEPCDCETGKLKANKSRTEIIQK